MFSLQDLLDLPLLRSARPEVIAGDGFAARPVRWVHTSEIFDISPLLKGGEVLFTTGLGLVGAPPGALTEYVRSLADQSVTALVMEIGRTFVTLPDEFVAAARTYGLPLIVLRRVIPFVEITETVHPLLIAPQMDRLVRSDSVRRQLVNGVLGGDDLAATVSAAAQIAEVPLGLYSVGGQLLAGDDLRAAADAAELTQIPVGPEPWAFLVAPSDPSGRTAEILDAAAMVVALGLAQRTKGSPTRALAVSDLLADMVSNRFSDDADLSARSAALGFILNPRRPAVAVACDLTNAAREGMAAVGRAARREFGANLVAEIEGRAVLVTQLRPRERAHEQLSALVAAVESELTAGGGGRVVRVVAGPLVESMATLARSLQRAVDGARLARRLGLPGQLLTDRDLGLYDLLTRVVPDNELEAFVEQQLGPLLQADARSGNRLVETLNAYLEAGRSKSLAAQALGIRRQTMYQRLERISGLLGVSDLAAQGRLTALDLAVTAWRMRTSGLTRQRGPGD